MFTRTTTCREAEKVDWRKTILQRDDLLILLQLCTGLFEMIVWGFNNLPPRSPDITPCDFFLWGYVKDQVYVPPLPASIPELNVRIRTAIETITTDMSQTVRNELDYRVDVCRITNGAHIEHL